MWPPQARTTFGVFAVNVIVMLVSLAVILLLQTWRASIIPFLASRLLPRSDVGHSNALLDTVKLFGMGYSWGGFESLCLPVAPARIRTAVKWTAPGDLFRIHVGLEDLDDLRADMAAALARYRAANSWFDEASGVASLPAAE